MQFNITDAVQRSVQSGMKRGMEQAANRLVQEVTKKLAENYDFDVDQAMTLLGVMSLDTKKKAKATTKSKRPSTKQPKVMEVQLPWCGEVLPNCCQAIKHSNRLYVQCMNGKQDGSDYCKRCETSAKKNNGNPVYGVIQDRLKDDYTGKNGEKPVNYGNYMKSKGIKREDAEAQATKLGWTIPEEQFVVVEVKKGRKPKAQKDNVQASDTEDEEDLVKQALQNAANDTSDEDSSDEEAPLKEGAKKRKANRKKGALKVAEDTESSGAEQDPKRACVMDENSELEEEEEELDVEPFEHNGKDYLIDDEDTLYDMNTQEPVGEYDRENNAITIF